MLKKSCSWKTLTIHIFFVRMYHYIKQFMIQAPYECEHNLGIHRHLVTVIITANKSTEGTMKKCLFSKHSTFNLSMSGPTDNNPSPSVTLLASSRFFLAACITIMDFVLFVCLLEVVCFAEGGIYFTNCVKLQICVCYSLNLRKKRKKYYLGACLYSTKH